MKELSDLINVDMAASVTGTMFYLTASNYLSTQKELTPEEQVLQKRLDEAPQDFKEKRAYFTQLSKDAVELGWDKLIPDTYANSQADDSVGDIALFALFKTQ